MTTLKIDIINGAYAEIEVSGITVGASGSDNALALSVLEDMAAEFDSRNICSGYNLQDEPDLNDVSNVERAYIGAFKKNLGVRLLAAFGKMANPALTAQANQSLSNMSARTFTLRETNAPRRMPRGSANTLRGNRWLRYERPPIQAPISCETNIMFINDVNDYIEHYDEFLNSGEDIASFVMTADDGLTIQSSANSFTDVTYRVKATATAADNAAFLQVKIVITTTDGRVDTRYIAFTVK